MELKNKLREYNKLLLENHQAREADNNKLLDRYRDNNWMSVYRCPICNFRGVGASVTLHFTLGCNGVMEREKAANERN